MTLAIRSVGGVIGSEVTGLDLARPLDAAKVNILKSAFADRSVLLFRDQLLSPEQQIDVGRLFGDPMPHPLLPAAMSSYPEIYVLFNTVGHDDRSEGAQSGYWYQDMSYLEFPARFALLYCPYAPPCKSETIFASTSHSYDALPQDLRARLSTLEALHGHGDFTLRYQHRTRRRVEHVPRVKRILPDVVHPVVVRNPESGRAALYVNEGFTIRIVGMPEQDSEELLSRLFAQTIREEFTYRHEWRAGDLVLWDNFSTVHSTTIDAPEPLPLLHRVAVMGDTLTTPM